MALFLSLSLIIFNLTNQGAQPYLFYNPITTIGYDAVMHNPANLALTNNPTYSLRLISVHLSVLNNLLSINSYNRYFGADSAMNNQDKTELFRTVPENGLSFDGNLNFGTMDFSYRNFGFTFRRFDLINLELAKELVDLALFGNQLGRTYDFSHFSLDYLAYYSFNFAYALPVIKKESHFASIGIGIKYLVGEDIKLTQQFSGNFYSDEYLMRGKIVWVRKMATGGNGWGINLGGTYELKKYRFSFALLNLSPGILWNKDVQNNFQKLVLDSFSVYGAIKSDNLDRFYQVQNLSYPIEPFRTALPIYLTIGAGRKFNNDGSILALIYEQNLIQTKFSTLMPKFTLNCEWNLMQFIMINPSVSLGGLEGLAFAFGLGKNIRRFSIGLHLQGIKNLIITQAKGIKFGFSVGITPP